MVTAIRRRAPDADGQATVEWFVFADPGELAGWHAALPSETSIVSCVSMSALGDPGWRGVWLDALHAVGTVDVLVDLDPFAHLRQWHAKGDFTTRYARIDLTDGERTHIVFMLHPETGEGMTYLAPCSAPVASALVTELQTLAAAGGRFEQDETFVHARMASLRLVLSHLMREEPWFDFRGGAR